MMFNSAQERLTDFNNLVRRETSEHKLLPSQQIDWDKLTSWLIENQFFFAPASTKYHGNYPGGLYDHCRCVYDRLVQLTEDNKLDWKRDISPFIVGMFHDLCKIDQYQWVEDSGVVMNLAQYNELIKGEKTLQGHYEYNTKTMIKGHGSKSVILLSQFMTLTEEEMLCIRYHMGAYEKEEWSEFDMAVRAYENVLWIHQADQLASKIDNL